MISVEEALHIILKNTVDYGIEEVDIQDSLHRILRENITADRDLPPYHRVTMDGICINHQAFAKGRRQFPIEGIVPAGSEQNRLSNSNNCLEIMTGAVLPSDADTIIRYEDLVISEGIAILQVNEVKSGQNVHRKGSDRLKGDLLIQSGRILGTAEMNVLATVGKSVVPVSKTPKVVIVSTGDELVEITKKPKPHQIRRSNVFGLQAVLRSLHVLSTTSHLPDDKKIIEEKLRNYLEEYDVIILSGGVSKGKFDYLPEMLDFMGVKKLFHKIRQRPGKPFWFGRHPNNTVVFALPGNPVSSFLCSYKYFIPWLYSSIRTEVTEPILAKLRSPILFPKDLTYYAQVKIINEEGILWAEPLMGNGSGDLASQVDADAFMELPRGKDKFEAGEAYPIISYRPRYSR